MKALIILAHGSRREESNQEIVVLADKVKNIANGKFDLIEYAYLEVIEPDLHKTIEIVINAGVSDITVFPYFLNSGNHVTRDIPAMVTTAMQKYPDCNFKITECIGMYKGMPELILQQIESG